MSKDNATQPPSDNNLPAVNSSNNALVASAASSADIREQVNLIQRVMRDVMKDGEHFGVIPGCGDKPALLKPGAEKLMLAFRFGNDLDVQVLDMPNFHREYRVKVTLHAPGGQRLGTGIGSCTTMETKYRYRSGQAELTNKPVPSGYWDIRKENPARAQQMLGGKGFTTKKNDAGQWMIAKATDRVEHDNPADYYNTCLKMAKKRGLIDAVLTSTAASDIFTQDVEEAPELHEYRNTPPLKKTNETVIDADPIPPSNPEQQAQKEESSSGNNDITAMLQAKNIPFTIEGTTVKAKPAYNDATGRDLVKSNGFKWNSSDKCWEKQL